MTIGFDTNSEGLPLGCTHYTLEDWATTRFSRREQSRWRWRQRVKHFKVLVHDLWAWI